MRGGENSGMGEVGGGIGGIFLLEEAAPSTELSSVYFYICFFSCMFSVLSDIALTSCLGF